MCSLWTYLYPSCKKKKISFYKKKKKKAIDDLKKYFNGFPGGSGVKESTCNKETWVQSLGWEDPLEEGM